MIKGQMGPKSVPIGFAGIAVPLFYTLCMVGRAKCTPWGRKLFAVSSFLQKLQLLRFSFFWHFISFPRPKEAFAALKRVEQAAEDLLQPFSTVDMSGAPYVALAVSSV